MIRYEINADNAVLAWDDQLPQTDPFLFQPVKPDGTPFADKAEAEAWAKVWFDEFTAAHNV